MFHKIWKISKWNLSDFWEPDIDLFSAEPTSNSQQDFKNFGSWLLLRLVLKYLYTFKAF